MELFDMVKAAPPPQTISAPERSAPPSPIPPDSPDAIATEAADDADLLQSAEIDEEGNNVEQRKNSPKRHIDSPPLPEQKSEQSLFKTPQNTQKYKLDEDKTDEAMLKTDEDDVANQVAEDKSENLEGNDSDGSLDGYPKTLPTKTKAQQKMFSDLPDQSASLSCDLREARVRVRRLTQAEIDSACASLAKSKFASHVTPTRKRGRPRKGADDKKSPSPAKKLKISPAAKIHIKVPLHSGAKKRGLANLARTHTPPPILSSRIKSKPKPKPKSKCLPKVSPAMIQRYGKRVFSCVVNVKKLKWPSKSGQRSRPKRSNLSVSFNESVEILGSNEGSSRRYTFGTISSKSPKPTRLQRVDATGNVLEDIALTANMLVSPSSAPSGSRGRGKRRSCNGSPQLKRPHQRIPLSGLASLRLDDGPRSDSDDDEEYIVPNELPGMQRPGTPTPKKKKISYTTTISDDEDEKTAPKKPKDSKEAPRREPKTKPNSRKVEKPTSLKESVLQNVVPQCKSNEIIKEKEQKESDVVPGKDDQRDAETEVQKVAEATTNDGEKPDTPRPVEMAEDNPQEAEEAAAVETDVGAGEKSVEENAEQNSEEKASVKESADKKSEEKSKASVEENAEKKTEEESKPKVEENGEKSPEEVSKANNAEKACETPDMSALELKEASRQLRDDKAKPDDVEVFRELDTPPSQPLPLHTTEENPDDVLEIQTSLEDVRQLHTPFSSQQSTPQASKRLRLDSGDSDCSFKSANEPNKEAQLEQGRGDEAVVKEEPAAGEDKSVIDSSGLTTPPPSTPTRTVNGCDPTSSATTVFYSPIEAMPTLDDEVLGQLVEPDFQLNSSRHAISRGTLDDIMTALES